MKALNVNYKDFDFKSIAQKDKKYVEKHKCDLSKLFGLALHDNKNTVYFYKDKKKRHKVYLALKKFYPCIEKLPDKVNAS